MCLEVPADLSPVRCLAPPGCLAVREDRHLGKPTRAQLADVPRECQDTWPMDVGSRLSSEQQTTLPRAVDQVAATGKCLRSKAVELGLRFVGQEGRRGAALWTHIGK